MFIRTTIIWVKKINKLVDIEEDPFEPIDIVEKVMGNEKNAVCNEFISRNDPKRRINSHNGEILIIILCVARNLSTGNIFRDT